MADEKPSLADLMDTAIAEASGNEPDSNAPAPDTSADDPAPDAAAADAAEGAEELESAEAAEGDEVAAADGEDDADGAAAGDETEGEGATDEAKAAAEAAKLVKAEKAALDAPIPKDAKQETADRIRTLIDVAKKATAERDEAVRAVTAERDTAVQERDGLVKTIQDTGMTPQQFGEHLNFERLARSKDTAPKALELLARVMQETAAYWGLEIPSYDPLAKYPDLQQAVQTGQMTAKYAKELAMTRNSTGLRANLDQQAQTQRQQQDQTNADYKASQDGLNQVEATLMASDPNYDAKKALLLKDKKFTAEMNATPHLQRPAKWLAAYQHVKLPAAPKAVSKNQPLRAKQGAGGAKSEPKNMQDAIFGALNSQFGV